MKKKEKSGLCHAIGQSTTAIYYHQPLYSFKAVQCPQTILLNRMLCLKNTQTVGATTGTSCKSGCQDEDKAA